MGGFNTFLNFVEGDIIMCRNTSYQPNQIIDGKIVNRNTSAEIGLCKILSVDPYRKGQQIEVEYPYINEKNGEFKVQKVTTWANKSQCTKIGEDYESYISNVETICTDANSVKVLK